MQGSLTSQDVVHDLMRLFPEGEAVLSSVRRYDEMLAQESREGHEPGDILRLITPFLLLHSITEDDIATLALEAKLLEGSARLINRLLLGGWKLFCISTCLEQYGQHITHKLGIFSHNTAFTPLPLSNMRQAITGEEMELLRRAEEDILSFDQSADAQQLKQRLDRFYGEELPSAKTGGAITGIAATGGRRKLSALNKYAGRSNQPLSGWVVIGDSLSDAGMLGAVDGSGGLAIAFNADRHALPRATAGLASTDVSSVDKVLETWQKNGRRGVEKLVKAREKKGGKVEAGIFHWLAGREDLDEIAEIHRKAKLLAHEGAG